MGGCSPGGQSAHRKCRILTEDHAGNVEHVAGVVGPSKYTPERVRPAIFAAMNKLTRVRHISALVEYPAAAVQAAFGAQKKTGSFMELNLSIIMSFA